MHGIEEVFLRSHPRHPGVHGRIPPERIIASSALLV
jgi:hypothetical protein